MPHKLKDSDTDVIVWIRCSNLILVVANAFTTFLVAV